MVCGANNMNLEKKSKFTEIYPILYYDITLRNDHIILDLFKE
jgi:hypothetical protein